MKKYLEFIKEMVQQNLFDECKKIVDSNGRVGTLQSPQQLIVGEKYIIYLSSDTMEHMNSHLSPSTKIGEAPGSYFTSDWRECISNVIESEPKTNELSFGTRYEWDAINVGKICGTSVVKYSDELKQSGIDNLPEGFKKYTYKRNISGSLVDETIIIKIDNGTQTNYMTVVGLKIGDPLGKTLISMWTAYPCGKNGLVDDKIPIPKERSEFLEQGLYFSVTKEFFNQV